MENKQKKMVKTTADCVGATEPQYVTDKREELAQKILFLISEYDSQEPQTSWVKLTYNSGWKTKFYPRGN